MKYIISTILIILSVNSFSQVHKYFVVSGDTLYLRNADGSDSIQLNRFGTAVLKADSATAYVTPTALTTGLATKQSTITAGSITNDKLANSAVANLSGTNTGDNATNTQYSGLAASKQNALVSGTNIKTVNGNNLLGSGDVSISSAVAWGGVTGTLSNQTDLQNALNAKLATNGNGSSLTGITNTQISGLGTLSTQNGNIADYFTIANAALKANIASPAFTGTPTGIGLPVYAQVTGSNVTTTGQVLANITGLTVPLTTNATYDIEAVLSVSTSAVTTGTAYGVNYSVAGGAIEAQITGSSTATASKTLRINAFNSATALYLATSAQTGGIVIKGRVTTGANAGDLTIQHLKLTSGTSTVFIGSFLKVTRIN